MPEQEFKRPHFTENYVRYRIYNPKGFKKFRTDDIGRKGHTKRIAGYSPQDQKWYTQAVIVDKKDYEAGQRVKILPKGRFKIIKVKSHKRRLR
jgi:hypothetical protein